MYIPRSGVDPDLTTSRDAFHEDVGEREHISSQSDDDHSDELESMSSDEERETLDRPRRKRCREFNEEVDMGNPEFRVGMKFLTADSLKKALKEHAIKSHRKIWFVKNNKEKNQSHMCR